MLSVWILIIDGRIYSDIRCNLRISVGETIDISAWCGKGLPVLSACLILSYLACRVLHELVTTRRERIGRGAQEERAAHDKPAFVEEGKQVDIKTDGKLGCTFGQRTVCQRQLGLVEQLLLFR